MNAYRKPVAVLGLVAVAICCGPFCKGQILPPSGLNRGVNFGNMLEAPSEGAWGLTVQEVFFDKVVEGGFDHIRLPVSWTHHAANNPPYTISPTFFQRIDWALQQAEGRGLKVILNIHHYDQLNSNPVAEWSRAIALWQQIAFRYRNSGSFLYFEILNEPHGVFNDQPELWNQFMSDALQAIRIWNPTRPVLVGPVRWNSIHALLTTSFNPPTDNNLIVAVHNYEPFEFTHQGASWVNPIPPVGIPWTGNLRGITSPWQNWSWGTTVANTTKGISVQYNQGWAGLYAHSDIGIDQCQKLRFYTTAAMNLRMVIRNTQQVEQAYLINTRFQRGDFEIALDPAFGRVVDIFVQNNTPSAKPPFLLHKLEIENASSTQSIVASEFEQIRNTMESAAAWAQARSLPLHCGEFGAYEQADMVSRAAWTRAVRTEAERLGMGWAYWELAAGFGVYNPDNSTWRQPLLDALMQ